MVQEKENLKELFQNGFSKMVAVISKLFELQHIEIAEDIVSETFLLALKPWEIQGIPANPTPWLYAVAKNKTVGHFRRTEIFDKKVVKELSLQQEKEAKIEEFEYSRQHIKDSQLQLLFAVCNPAIASEAPIGVALQILCGFRHR
jgi:predicted RNA polymerase sigma factor